MKMKNHRVVKTTRLLFGKFEEKHFSDYFSVTGNSETMKMITGDALDKQEAERRFEQIIQQNITSSFGFYRVSLRNGGDFIGYCKLVKINSIEAEIGYALLPRFWNKAYGSEISEALIRLAGNDEGIARLIAIVDPENIASIKILVKNNFSLKEQCLIDGFPAEIYERMLK